MRRIVDNASITVGSWLVMSDMAAVSVRWLEGASPEGAKWEENEDGGDDAVFSFLNPVRSNPLQNYEND